MFADGNDSEHLFVLDAMLYCMFWVSSQMWHLLLCSGEIQLLGNIQINEKQFIIINSDLSDQGKAQGAIKDPSRGYQISPRGGVRDELLEAAFKLNVKKDLR